MNRAESCQLCRGHASAANGMDCVVSTVNDVSFMELTDFPSLIETIRMAMRLNPWIYAAIQVAPGGIWIALMVVGLASFSESLGQSVVLFINRVRPRRFMLALTITIVSQIVGFWIWALSVWLISTYAFEGGQSFVPLAAAVGLAYAPQIWAFFELTPFLGNAFSLILSLWSMLAIVVAVRGGGGLDVWQAIVTGLLSWMLIQLFRRSIGRPIYALRDWMQRRAAGNALDFTVHDVPRLRHRSEFIENWETWLDALSRSKWLDSLGQRLDRSKETAPRGKEEKATGNPPDPAAGQPPASADGRLPHQGARKQ